MKLFNFRIEPEILEEFQKKYRNASGKLRDLVVTDLRGSANIPQIQRDDIANLKKLIFEDDSPVQVIGSVGVGKTTAIQKLIESDKNHIYIILDCHREYNKNLPEIQVITDDIKNNSKISLPEQISASKGLYPVYHNQLLSRKFPENYVVVLEEAHRFKETKELLKEARKFIKVIAITQESLGDFCPKIEVLK